MLGLVGDVEAPADGGAGGGGPRREVVPQHVLPAPCQNGKFFVSKSEVKIA